MLNDFAFPMQPSRFIASSALVVVIATMSASMALGQSAPPKRGTLPKEAFTTCETLAENDSCPITTPDNKKITGVCRMTPEKKLACMPADAPQPQPRSN